MRGIEKLPQLLAMKIQGQGGFLQDNDIQQITKVAPDLEILVRCNNGRFLTSAQHAFHFASIIDNHCKILENQHGGTIEALLNGADYVRDFSLPA